MLKARYSPATEDLAAQILQNVSPGLQTEPGFKAKLRQCLSVLRDEMGYEVSIEVEVHGAMEEAFRSLEGDTSEYILHQRPVRRVKT